MRGKLMKWHTMRRATIVWAVWLGLHWQSVVAQPAYDAAEMGQFLTSGPRLKQEAELFRTKPQEARTQWRQAYRRFYPKLELTPEQIEQATDLLCRLRTSVLRHLPGCEQLPGGDVAVQEQIVKGLHPLFPPPHRDQALLGVIGEGCFGLYLETGTLDYLDRALLALPSSDLRLFAHVRDPGFPDFLKAILRKAEREGISTPDERRRYPVCYDGAVKAPLDWPAEGECRYSAAIALAYKDLMTAVVRHRMDDWYIRYLLEHYPVYERFGEAFGWHLPWPDEVVEWLQANKRDRSEFELFATTLVQAYPARKLGPIHDNNPKFRPWLDEALKLEIAEANAVLTSKWDPKQVKIPNEKPVQGQGDQR